MSDLPSQYTVDMEMFEQIFSIPDSRDSMSVSSVLAMGLNPVAQKQELRPKGPSSFHPANPSLKRP